MDTTWEGGGIPVGYLYDKELKQLYFDPKLKPVVQLIFDFALSGLSALQIAGELNKRKMRSKQGNEWSYKTVAYLFTPAKLMFYAGFQDEKQGNWPSIISVTTAEKLIAKNVVSTVLPRPRHNVFLLSGLDICYCGYCGGKIKSSTTKRAKTTNHYYLCGNKQMRGAVYCPESKVIPQQLLNDKIIASVLTQHDNLKSIQKFSVAFRERTIKSSHSALNTITKQINQLLVKQNKTSKTSELNSIGKEIQILINQRASLISNQLIDINFAELNNIDLKGFNRFAIAKQQTIIKQFIQRVVVKRDKITIEFPFVINSKGDKYITTQY
jgi:hypothetical protein